jgi:hypothetical protein
MSTILRILPKFFLIRLFARDISDIFTPVFLGLHDSRGPYREFGLNLWEIGRLFTTGGMTIGPFIPPKIGFPFSAARGKEIT